MKNLTVRREDFDDRSEPDAEGYYDYIYVGTNYTFECGGEKVVLRQYRDEPTLAILLSPYWRPELVNSELLREALSYMRSEASIEVVESLSGGDESRIVLQEFLSSLPSSAQGQSSS